MDFKDLGVIPIIERALEEEEYTKPTPIQQLAIPVVITGQDLLGCAQTGTGKTAAFAVPTLQRLLKNKTVGKRKIRSVVLAPTRELALQIFESFKTYGRHTGLKICAIFGGVSQKPQEEALRHGVDIVVATPGRMLDLMRQRLADLRNVEVLTLDEADRMLEMGMFQEVKKIIAKTPRTRQTLFFSATMPAEVDALSKSILKDPEKITIAPSSPAVETVEQQVYYVDRVNKRKLLLHLLKDPSLESVLVFTRTKHGADRVARDLIRKHIRTHAIHGNKSQSARQRALNSFKKKETRVLVATDIAARGLDIDELSHVINFDLPDMTETYVHRIGRTGRAGKSGTSISFCDFDEINLLMDIEKLCGKPITEVPDHPFPLQMISGSSQPGQSRPPHNKQQHGQRPSGSGSRRSHGGYKVKQGQRKPSGHTSHHNKQSAKQYKGKRKPR